MNENEFEYSGKRYAAKPHNGCDGCAFDTIEFIGGGCFFANCHASERTDNSSVIFVEVQDERAKG